jgi:SAM-dependent methyltransferase
MMINPNNKTFRFMVHDILSKSTTMSENSINSWLELAKTVEYNDACIELKNRAKKKKELLVSYAKKRAKSKARAIIIGKNETDSNENIVLLDIGTEDPFIFDELVNLYGLKYKNLHAINVRMYEGTNYGLLPEDTSKLKFNFKWYDGKKIPYNDNTFDIVSLFMVFHHIPYTEQQSFIAEIHRVMKKRGRLIIKEHDIKNKTSLNIIKFEHVIYDKILEEENDGDFTPENIYGRSKRKLIELFTDNNRFKLLHHTKVSNNYKAYNRSFYMTLEKT